MLLPLSGWSMFIIDMDIEVAGWKFVENIMNPSGADCVPTERTVPRSPPIGIADSITTIGII